MRLAAGLFLLAAWLAAAPQDGVDLDGLIDRARSVPAEFAADALIRLAQSDRVAKAKKPELLEEAFRRATGAQQPLKKRAIPAVRTGAAAFLNRAFAQDLDANSLQCRAVRGMLELNPRKAREMFTDIPRPAPAKLTCDDALVPDVSIYYETLAEVAKSGFSAAEIEDDEPFKLLASYVAALSSPTQVGPIARLLASSPLKRPQLDALAMSFGGSLKNLSGDDRSFSQAISRQGGAGQGIASLAARCTEMEISSLPLLEAYRAFLVRHFTANRCTDGGERGGIAFGVVAKDDTVEQDPARFFNESLRVDPIKPLGADEVQPAKLEGAAGQQNSCDSQDCRRLVGLYRELIFDSRGLPYGPDKKATSEWQAKAKEYLGALAAWKEETGASTADLFQQKCALYSEFANVVPNGPDRVAVLRAFLAFLSQNSVQRENRAEWFLPVNSLVARVSLQRASLDELWRDMRGSADPLIALYCELEELAPRSPGTRLSIF
ncbi:MAG TPA: hypothetical protein VN442_13470 [Bryobacteraceae bacterium]|nr:hypothetical protein [Bryobacteraceae bacterium]